MGQVDCPSGREEDLSVLEEDLVSSCRGTWSLVKKGGYYGVSIAYSPAGA
ncbi:MAG: hypothetical protein ACLSUW_05570 [Akkermansia sp.]